MLPMIRIRVPPVEFLLQELHADALRASELFQRRRFPRLVFHHFGKQRIGRMPARLLRQLEVWIGPFHRFKKVALEHHEGGAD